MQQISILGAFHLVTQVDTELFYFSWHSSNKETILVSTGVTKWKAPISISRLSLIINRVLTAFENFTRVTLEYHLFIIFIIYYV